MRPTETSGETSDLEGATVEDEEGPLNAYPVDDLDEFFAWLGKQNQRGDGVGHVARSYGTARCTREDFNVVWDEWQAQRSEPVVVDLMAYMRSCTRDPRV